MGRMGVLQSLRGLAMGSQWFESAIDRSRRGDALGEEHDGQCHDWGRGG